MQRDAVQPAHNPFPCWIPHHRLPEMRPRVQVALKAKDEIDTEGPIGRNQEFWSVGLMKDAVGRIDWGVTSFPLILQRTTLLWWLTIWRAASR